MRPKKLLMTFMILALLALPVAGYLFYLDVAEPEDSFCSINSTFDCVSVSKTKFAYFLGVPVAIWGLLMYSTLFIVSLGLYKGFRFRKIYRKLKDKYVYHLLTAASVFGLAFSLYLTYAELVIIKAFCIFCLAQQAIIIVMFLLALMMSLKQK